MTYVVARLSIRKKTSTMQVRQVRQGFVDASAAAEKGQVKFR
jgi:hypothetical protein